jgi:hypothetical protein
LKPIDSGRSKSMFPFLPSHPHQQHQQHSSPLHHGQGEGLLGDAADGIVRTDSPETIGYQHPQQATKSFPPTAAGNQHTASPEVLTTALASPNTALAADPWGGIKSKSFDMLQQQPRLGSNQQQQQHQQPRVAGIRSPIFSAGGGLAGGNAGNVPLGMEPSSATSVPGGGVANAVTEDQILHELKEWGFGEEKLCLVTLEGKEENVRAAKVLLLLLIDQLVSCVAFASIWCKADRQPSAL